MCQTCKICAKYFKNKKNTVSIMEAINFVWVGVTKSLE